MRVVRRISVAALLAATSLSAVAQAPSFESVVGAEARQALRNQQIQLSPMRPAFHLTFYSDALNRPEELACEREAGFGLVAMANEGGALLVAVCEANAAAVGRHGEAGRRGLADALAALRGSGTKIDDAAIEKAQWSYQRVDASDGREHRFPVLILGHGVVGPQTLVFLPKGQRRAVVVQADVRRLCEIDVAASGPLCSDLRGTMARLARAVLARVPAR